MNKTCALILSGFLRDVENLRHLESFIKRNPKYSIDIYICTYNVMGLVCKSSDRDADTASVTRETFTRYPYLRDRIKSINIQPYVKTQHILRKFIKAKGFVDADVKLSRVHLQQGHARPPKQWLHMMFSQFFMIHKNVQEVKKINKKYDIIIKSRFDIRHKRLPDIPSNVKSGTFYGAIAGGNSGRKYGWVSRIHRAVTDSVGSNKVFRLKRGKDSFPLVHDWYFVLHADHLNSLESAYDIESASKRYRDDYWIRYHKHSCELHLSIGLFVEGDLKNFKTILDPPPIGINRTKKW